MERSDKSGTVEIIGHELPPLPLSPPPIELIPPLPSQMSNLNAIEPTHLDFDPGLGEQLSNGTFSENDDHLNETDGDEPPAKIRRTDSGMHSQAPEEFADGDKHCSNLEFDVLDEMNEDETTQDEHRDYDSDSSDEFIDEDEIDAMLDESLKKNFGKPGGLKNEDSLDLKDIEHDVMEKIVMKAISRDHFEFLPEGWIEVTHNSGMPVYLHKETRVCSFSPPYFLGRGSVRKHEIPMSAIPCLHYDTQLKQQKEAASSKCSISSDENGLAKPSPATSNVKVEGINEILKQKSLDAMTVRKYCENVFQFHTVTVRKFKSWASKRKHEKLMKQKQRPTLPADTKLITCQVRRSNLGDGKSKPSGGIPKEFIMNPTGKSFICILHEYVQHSMRVQPKYKFKELENSSFPYSAVVSIKDMEYGTGYGASKKLAKSEAAKNTLEILIPQMKSFNSDKNPKSSKNSCHLSSVQEQDLSFFDEIRVEDPRVHELCTKAGLSSPYQLLLECLRRNYGMGDTEVAFETKMLKHQKNDFTMAVGKHKASVICKNKKDGKQRASQAILQALHPHITCWGSLLRLYGKGSCKTIKEKKQEEQEITELQNKACAHRPNFSILSKLKDEMVKLKDQRDKVKPIGKFIPTDVEIPSVSASDLRNVDL